jgi:hypothetical protein
MKIDSATVKRVFAGSDDDNVSDDTPSSAAPAYDAGEDAAPYRGDSTEFEAVERVIKVSAKDRKAIREVISGGIQGVGMGLAFRCQECGDLLSDSADDMAEAVTNVICHSQKRVEWFLSSGTDSKDTIVLILTLAPVAAAIAHHHVPFLQKDEPAPPRPADLLQPQVPQWTR